MVFFGLKKAYPFFPAYSVLTRLLLKFDYQ